MAASRERSSPDSASAMEVDQDEPRRLTPFFRSVFQGIPAEESLIKVYACAYQLDSLVQGKLYLTEHYLCFHSNLVGWETVLTIKFCEVTAIEKVRTALVIPNAICIHTPHHEYTFTSFISREQAYVNLQELWQRGKIVSTPATSDFTPSPAPSETIDSSLEPLQLPTIEVSALQSGSETSTRGLIHVGPPLQAEIIEDDHADVLEPAPAVPDVDEPSESALVEGECGCGDQHLERDAVFEVLPCDVDTLFQLLFAHDSKFLAAFLAQDCGCSDVSSGEWSGKGPGSTRALTYTKPLSKNSLGPTSAEVREHQVLVTCDPGLRITVAVDSRMPDIPYGECFYTTCRYCITKHGSGARLQVGVGVVWVKSAMGMMKSYITKSAYEGMDGQFSQLVTALRRYLEKGGLEAPGPAIVPKVRQKPSVPKGDDYAGTKLLMLLVGVLVLACVLLWSNLQLLGRIARLESALVHIQVPEPISVPSDAGAACEALVRELEARHEYSNSKLRRRMQDLEAAVVQVQTAAERLRELDGPRPR